MRCAMQVFYTEGGVCLERAAWGGGGSKYDMAFKGHLDKDMNRMGMEGYGLRNCIQF